ncbi:MAG TPA: GAF domain-containing protein, partial [Vicinamibacterales bacterium]
VAQRTGELQASNGQLAQRAAELAVINSIQEGIAAELELQAIIDLVGDKLREVFATGDIGIWWWDAERRQGHASYVFEHGVRQHHAPYTVKPGEVWERLFDGRETLLVHNRAESMALGMHALEGTDQSLSALCMPIVGGDRVLGSVVLEDYERENAFGPDAVRLLGTVVASMGVALENARLFDETQRLLKETEQRNAELAVINSIQQGVAGSLDFQRIVDLVGDKLREVFDTGDMGIRWLDEKTGEILCLYEYEHGTRLHPAPFKVDWTRPLPSRVRHGETVVLNSRAESAALGVETIPGTDSSASSVFVPIMNGERLLGTIVLEDYQREGAFSPSRVRMLQTVASGMGVALENARLFDETQRLLKETERRSAELAVINTIQQGMAREMNFRAIVELVGDKLREVFASNDISIHSADLVTLDARALYVVERGERKRFPDYKVDLAQPVMQKTMRGEVVLARNPREIADVMGLTVDTLDTEVEQFPGTHRSKTIVWVPINASPERLYALVLESADHEDAFSAADISLLRTVAASMGVALENARLFDETQRLLKETERRERESSALSEVGRDLSSTLDLAPLMDRIAAHAKELLAAADSAIFLPAADRRTYRAIVAHGRSAEALRATTIVRGEGIIGRLIDSGQPELINDAHADTRGVQVAGTTTQDGERMMVVPLLSGEDVKGAMVVWRTGGAPFDSRDLDFLVGLSRHAAVALHNAKLFDETRQALERQTAAAEVLQVISGSMADPKPVFDKILDSCTRLFGAGDPAVCLVDGDVLRIGSYRGQFAQEVEQAFPRPLAGTLSDMAIRRGSVLYLPSVLATDDLPPYIVDVARKRGDYSVVNAPMNRNGRGIGTIDIICMPPRAFSDAELGLVKTFADQAVIAIQNARLFNETQEALAQQTASADILRVISRSPTDVQPVFDAIVTTAVKHLGCDLAIVQICSGDTYSPKALATPDGLMPVPGSTVMPIDPDANFPSRAIVSKAMLHLRDWSTIELPAHERARHEQLGLNSTLYLPLLRGDACVGVLVLGNKRANGFNDKAIALAESFRDQAVIAIENVRLFTETREALERQTTTAEILKVISSSPTDTQPVFDAIVQSAARLFGRKAALRTVEPDGLRRRARSYHLGEEFHGAEVLPVDRDNLAGRAVIECRVQQIADTRAPDAPAYARENALRLAYRAAASAPLVHEGRAIGVISVSSPEPGALTEQQMALLSTFADQAVIAIQNARLFNETREALERQTATADVLKVISESRKDVQPVVDVIAERAARLTGADYGWVFRYDGELIHVQSAFGVNAAGVEAARKAFPMPPGGGSAVARAVRDGAVVNIGDVRSDVDAEYKIASVAELAGYRSILSVPMWRDRSIVGAITVTRAQVGRFADKEVDLLQTFARQAAIATENVRLFNETEEALARQTASADILRVISQSPTDVLPVFEAIVRTAVRLLDCDMSFVFRRAGNEIAVDAGATPDGPVDVRVPMLPLDPSANFPSRVVVGKSMLHLPDWNAIELPEHERVVRQAFGVGATLYLPMLRDDECIGLLVFGRRAAGAFNAKEIAVAESFRDQALIAIENVRLFNETREALERQTATAEILRVISESPSDVQPVLEAVAERASQLCHAEGGRVWLVEEGQLRARTSYGPAYAALHDFEVVPLRASSIGGRAVLERRVVHVEDVVPLIDSEYPDIRDIQRRYGFRTVLLVPLLREGEAIGTISLLRNKVQPFAPSEIELVQTFADQAVIAIENVRLFKETQDALARQTATAEVLQVISESPTDVQPVLDVIAERATHLTSADYGWVFRFDGKLIHVASSFGLNTAGLEASKRAFPMPPGN